MIQRLVLACALLLIPGAIEAQSLDHATIESIEHVVSSYMSKHGIPGVSIAIAVQGSVVWSILSNLEDASERLETATAIGDIVSGHLR
jgi:hypothetical protein